jgi:hypothetical protein
MGFRSKRTVTLCRGQLEGLKAWLELDERDFGFRLLTEEEFAAETLFFTFISTACIIMFLDLFVL